MQIGFPGLLALIFITLKLTDFIDWSWWWVLAPIWLFPVIVFGVLLVVSVLTGRRITITRKK